MGFLETGKLDQYFLERILGKIEIKDKRVIVGPGIGEDAAVIDVGGHYLIVKCDPITFTTDRIGWYVVNVNANDIAAMGGDPRWFLVTMLLPEGQTSVQLIENIMKDLEKACDELGVSLIGGHTEVTHGLEYPILSGTMLGEAKKDELIKNGSIGEGDLLYMTKGVAIEATSIIAREKATEVRESFGDEFYRRCINFLQDPGISVIKDAKRVRTETEVTGMHDPTEGGILTGAYEMARGSGIGVRIWVKKIPVFEETRKLCDHYGISPFYCIASGSLLISVPSNDRDRLERAFTQRGEKEPRLTLIGEFTNKGGPVCVVENGKEREIHPSGRDELTKLM
ncbi:MAG: AIR synthase family protein [Spirochaetota bacterium]|nr:MAG: AIR synthase family protein [Spirochaetota bacterium]